MLTLKTYSFKPNLFGNLSIINLSKFGDLNDIKLRCDKTLEILSDLRTVIQDNMTEFNDMISCINLQLVDNVRKKCLRLIRDLKDQINNITDLLKTLCTFKKQQQYCQNCEYIIKTYQDFLTYIEIHFDNIMISLTY